MSSEQNQTKESLREIRRAWCHSRV